MTEAIIVAIITGVLSLIGVIASNTSTQKLTAYKIDELKTDTADKIKDLKDDFSDLKVKVEKHNNLIERMAVVERDLKTAFNRVDELKTDIKDLRR